MLPVLALASRGAAASFWVAGCRGCILRHLIVLLGFITLRFGEAAHPGPATFTLGALNATGLFGKQGIIAQLPPGLFAVSETHLTSRAAHDFNRGLFHANSCHKLLPGSPAPLRANSSVAGEYTGVGFLASVPARPAAHAWHPDVFASARLQVVHAFADPVWILAGVCYGFASGPVSRTHLLLEQLTERVVDSATGPRVLAGDFNLTEEANPFQQRWAQAGFVEVQQLWARMTGAPLQHTCKGSTRKDFLYVSAELLPLVVQVWLEADWFPDHAVLFARLRLPCTPLARPVWRMPRPRPLPVAVQRAIPPVLPALLREVSAASRPDDRYVAIWSAYEDCVSRALVSAGQPPLGVPERGRGATLDVHIRRGQPAPLRKARAGEVEHAFFGQNQKYAHWFRQLRRLQAVCQAIRKASDQPHAVHHRASTWHAVLRAPGFAPSFADWWRTRPQRLHHAPLELPLCLPDFLLATSIFQCFEANFRVFERDLLSSRRRRAKQRRFQQPSLIFKDVQRDRSCPVTTLIEGPCAEVCEVDPDEQALIVAPAQDWDPAQPVFVDGAPLVPIHVEPDKLWLPAMPSSPRQVKQERHIAALPDVFRAFGEAWSARWLKHSNVEVERWHLAVAHMDQVLPPSAPMPYLPVTPAQWRAAVMSKKATTAAGPDGIARLDLVLLPDDLLDFLLAVCEEAEKSGQWPMGAMTAIITALEKLPGADRVAQFHPISVLALVYRAWASVRAKQALRHLAPLVPVHMYGMLPGKSAQSVWWHMQFRVEEAHLAKSRLVGVSSDLEKAFNLLPRVPVLTYALHMGLPLPVVRAWTAATTLLSRRFRVRGSVGPPIASLTGFPEGDPLSCVAMSLVCLAYHAHLSARVPAALPVSYVDNWEAVAPEPQAAVSAYQAMLDFCSAWDIRLDESKTFFWATQAADRRWLRARHCKVVHDVRDLGGHLQFTRKPANHVLVSRIKALDELWPKLGASHAPYPAKLRAVVASAWPRALYGASICSLGQKYVSALRAAALRALGASKPGASAAAHLALVEHPAADPGFVLFRASLVDVRAQVGAPVFASVLDHLCRGLAAACPGPAGLFLRRAHAVGWSWDPALQQFRDSWSAFDMWECSPQELLCRAAWSWQVAVASTLASRPGFAGLPYSDFHFTRQSIRHLPPPDQALMRVALNGTFFTQDALQHFDEQVTCACRFCGQPDSLVHRVEQCPFFAAGRVETGFSRLLRDRPLQPAHKLHAWAPLPDSLSAFRGLLSAVPFPVLSSMDFGGMDLFTDGTCLSPRQPHLRLAAWAVVVGVPTGEPCLLASGPLPGLHQSSFRAELFAVWFLFRVGVASSLPFRIWTDCLGVVRRVRALRSALYPPTAMASNSDLWRGIWESLQMLEADFEINHVPSHEDLEAHTDPVDKWVLAHNHAADRAAAEANLDRPDLFWESYSALCDEVHRQVDVQDTVVRYHLWLARTAIRSQQPAVLGTPGPIRVVGSVPLCWPPRGVCSDRAAGHFGAWFTSALNGWLPKISSGTESETRWISWVQLVTDFLMATGLHPPVQKGGRWADPSLGPAGVLFEWSMTRASRSFARQVRFVCRDGGVQLQTTETHPDSAAFALQLCCVWLPYPQSRWNIVDGWLARQVAFIDVGMVRDRHRRSWTRIGRPPLEAALASM